MERRSILRRPLGRWRIAAFAGAPRSSWVEWHKDKMTGQIPRSESAAPEDYLGSGNHGTGGSGSQVGLDSSGAAAGHKSVNVNGFISGGWHGGGGLVAGIADFMLALNARYGQRSALMSIELADLTDCFHVQTNAHGEKGTYAKYSYRPGGLVYRVRGEAQRERTRRTIEVGADQHVCDPHAEFINHSFTPNLELRGREMLALTEIAPGDELTFDYLQNESAIAEPFESHDTGQRVDSDGCGGR